jgi:tRNA 2-thiouridine synthesizing protein A
MCPGTLRHPCSKLCTALREVPRIWAICLWVFWSFWRSELNSLESKDSPFPDQRKTILIFIPQCGRLGQEVFLLANQTREDGMDEGSVGFDRGTSKMAEVRRIRSDQELNLKGKICPYTFIESMLALEDMKPDEVLRVIVDYPPAVCDVPRSLKNEGYEILEVSPVNETDWAILVRNKGVE